MEQITLTQALAEVKLLDKRIKDSINKAKFCESIEGNKTLLGSSKENAVVSIESNYRSICDLIKRRSLIKARLNLANATTKVIFKNKELTIAELIDEKKTVEYKQFLLSKFRTNLYETQNQTQAYNQEKLQIQASSGKELDLSKLVTATVLDPLKLETKLILDLEQEVYEFSRDVDVVLSTINATTKIDLI